MRRNSDLVAKFVNDVSLGATFTRWAQQEPSICILVMIGSQARGNGEVGSADEGSDWDFQVVTTQPNLFANGAWARSAGLSKPLAYVTRPGRLGRVAKMSAVFFEGELDIVLIPFSPLRVIKWLCKLRLVKVFPRVQGAVAELALVLRPGYRVLKGSESWRSFFHRIVSEIVPPRLDDNAICAIAEAYVCDYVSTRRKIARGELLAAQRWLHCQLAEANFRLLHELRLRSHEISFPDARRIELFTRDHWRQAVTIDALSDQQSLSDAVDRSAQTCRDLVRALTGSKWQWPDIPLRLR